MPSSLKKRLTNARENSIIMIHNHPNSSPFSTADYDTSTKYKSCFETIACGHNGDLYVFRNTFGTEGTLIPEHGNETIRDFRVAFTKYSKFYPDFEARHKAGEDVSNQRGFYYEKI